MKPAPLINHHLMNFSRALAQSDHLVIEADLSKLEINYTHLAMGTYPSDSSLSDVIIPKTRKKITQYCGCATMLRAFPYMNFKPGLLDAFMEAMVLQDNGVYQSREEEILLITMQKIDKSPCTILNQ